MNTDKESCVFYDRRMNRCRALRRLYCQEEECSFYKQGRETNDGFLKSVDSLTDDMGG